MWAHGMGWTDAWHLWHHAAGKLGKPLSSPRARGGDTQGWRGMQAQVYRGAGRWGGGGGGHMETSFGAGEQVDVPGRAPGCWGEGGIKITVGRRRGAGGGCSRVVGDIGHRDGPGKVEFAGEGAQFLATEPLRADAKLVAGVICLTNLQVKS